MSEKIRREKTDPDGPVFSTFGCTKREYFAAMALQGLLVRRHPQENSVSLAVSYADQLVDELNQEFEAEG